MSDNLTIRKAEQSEYKRIGEIMVDVYSALEGFPKQSDQPQYYEMLANIGEITNKAHTELIVAVDKNEQVAGAVVYFTDMSSYGSGGTATGEKNAAGFRLLAVDPAFQGRGVGRLLSQYCIDRTRELQIPRLLIHSTVSMKIAWGLYERLGFKRYEYLDFMQGELEVFGYQLVIN